MTSHKQPKNSQSLDILNRLGIAEEEWRAQGIATKTLVAIYYDFLQRKSELMDVAELTASVMQQIPQVHAVRYRVKDPLHLLRKVIRKKYEYPDRTIDEHNYVDWINDLAGVRVLYLYKECWREVGSFIQDTWELKRAPIAYINAETDTATAQMFSEAGCNIRHHDQGYRAVHYVIHSNTKRQRYFVEIQLRTLFEEGWSEIDHSIRYPDHTCGATIRDLLTILNRLTGQADQIASFIKTVLDKAYTSQPLTQPEQTQLLDQLHNLPIGPKEKRRLQMHVEQMLRRAK
ncbi:RelA/SpoT domain-containing protein [uncultured Pontibacter sp.]|uniref:RelA/SpoT domain-containing protein n=1 Tax=uncultured Pontibacter sp. TaxID=453356 RepID=UPI002612D442|nr:RelA/SpoT domain-containing protein [uncultured Pontibacter sp.]